MPPTLTASSCRPARGRRAGAASTQDGGELRHVAREVVWSAARQLPSEQKARASRMVRATFALNGSGSSGGRTESRRQFARRGSGARARTPSRASSVRDAVERDLVEAQRLPHGLEVLRVLGSRVEVRTAPSEAAHTASRGALGVGRARLLQCGAVEQSGVAGAAVVVGDERVTREEIAIIGDNRGRTGRTRVPSPGRGRLQSICLRPRLTPTLARPRRAASPSPARRRSGRAARRCPSRPPSSYRRPTASQRGTNGETGGNGRRLRACGGRPSARTGGRAATPPVPELTGTC